MTWLLKLCDIIQVWDKPLTKDYLIERTYPTTLSVIFEKNSIVFANFPNETKEKQKEKQKITNDILNYFNTDFIKIEIR